MNYPKLTFKRWILIFALSAMPCLVAMVAQAEELPARTPNDCFITAIERSAKMRLEGKIGWSHILVVTWGKGSPEIGHAWFVFEYPKNSNVYYAYDDSGTVRIPSASANKLFRTPYELALALNIQRRVKKPIYSANFAD